MNQYRIESRRPGIHYELKYRKTLHGATSCARRELYDKSEFLRPHEVRIELRQEGYHCPTWTLVTIVTRDGQGWIVCTEVDGSTD